MRRAIRWMLGFFAALAGLPVLAVLLVWAAANTAPLRQWVERSLPEWTDGKVRVAGIAGRFPGALRLGHLELRDADGPWLAIDQAALDWSPSRMLTGLAQIDRLEAGHIALNRLPPPSPAESAPSAKFSLPLRVALDALRVEHLDLGAAIIGKPASLAVDAKARLLSLADGEATIGLRRLDGDGHYRLQGSLTAGAIKATVSAQEPPLGLLATLAGIEEPDALALDIAATGPLAALQAQATLAFGPLRVALQGQLDLEYDSITQLAATASAPAMRPRPDLSWQAVALEARLQGPFTNPTAQGRLRIDALQAAATAIRAISVDLQGDAGQAQLHGQIEGLRLPGPHADLFESAPFTLEAHAQLDQAGRPVSFALQHPLIAAEGRVLTAGDLRGEALLHLPNLQAYAALGGLDVQGDTALNLKLARLGEATQLDVDGTLAVTGGGPPWPALLGNHAKLGVAAELRNDAIKLSRLALDGKAVALSANGLLAGQKAGFDWTLALHDWAAVMAGASGRLAATGRIEGPLDKLALAAKLDGEFATKELPRGPVSATLKLEGLPDAPTGHATAQGVFGGAPLNLALDAEARADGSLRLALERADWKSAHAQAGLELPKGAVLPVGTLDLHVARLDDLQPLLGQPLVGSATASMAIAQAGPARIKLEAHDAGVVGAATAAQTRLDLNVNDPLKHPRFDGRLNLDGIAAGGVGGSAQLDLAGPLEALDLRLSAALQTPIGDTQSKLAARLDLPAKQLGLSEAQVEWKNEKLALLAPARVRFGDGLAVDRLRLGLREAVLALDGRINPSLDLTASLRNVEAGLAALFVPGLDAAGNLRADARLTGTAAHPVGSVELEASGLQMRTGAGRGLPPVQLAASARLSGTAAHVDGKLDAGRELALTVGGELPLTAAGPLDLQASGAVDLKMLDPWLTPDGRRARGQLALNGRYTGSAAAPQISGKATLSGGDLRDYGIGAHLGELSAVLEADGGAVRIAKLEGRAGPGKISATGGLDLRAAGMPLNLSVTARDARPLTGERLSLDVDTDLKLQGQAQGPLTANGRLHINRAEIRIPERLPASVAVLKLRQPGEAPPPPPTPGPDIGLDLKIDAPGQIFVRGHGLDAELGGKIHLRGSAGKPRPDGGFTLRRGQFSVAGQTLAFSKGEVGFDGGSLADPSLNFIAQASSAKVTAYLAVTGTASQPKISLSSVPELPQDEVLAQLLFGRATSSLSPLEMVQIASTLASLTGVTAGVSNPLEGLRDTLGLDRLSVGSSVEAGRYLAPGVYVGAKQGVTGGSQATVQIDIAKGLKLEGSAGTGQSSGSGASGSGGNSVGVIYQHEY